MLKKIIVSLLLMATVIACNGCGGESPKTMEVYCGECNSDYWYEVMEHEEEGHHWNSLYASPCSACELRKDFLEKHEAYLSSAVSMDSVWVILEEELPYEQAAMINDMIIEHDASNYDSPLDYFYD